MRKLVTYLGKKTQRVVLVENLNTVFNSLVYQHKLKE